jgi:membrane protease subunit HflC
MNRVIVLAVLAATLVIGLASSAFTVHQTQQVLVTQFGEPVRVIREPGLKWKLPFIQRVISFDRRLLDFDSAPQEVVLGSQRRLVVDAFTRYRITDPLRFFQSVGATEAGIRSRLEPSVTSALRGVLANETLPAVLSADRGRIMGEIRRRVESDARDLGIDVVDVRIRRADLPEQNTQPILQRMQSERERVAREQRAQGAEAAQRIVAAADRDRTVLLAEAQAKANALRGEGEQAAIGIFAEAFQRDPEFFQFWRTMQAWREAFADGETRMLLSPDSDFFRYFRSIPTTGGNAGGGGGGGGAPPTRQPPAADAPR